MKKLLFLDVETTGLDPKKNGLIQIAGIVEIDGQEIEKFNYKLKPFPGDLCNAEALKVNGTTIETIKTFEDPISVHKQFTDLLCRHVDTYDKADKFHMVGYNVKFDDQFLREWFTKCANKYYGSFFFWPGIDVSVLAAMKVLNRRGTFGNFKLMTVAKALGVNTEGPAHDALFDVEVTRDLFNNLGG